MENRYLTGYAPAALASFFRQDRRGTVLMANSAGIYLDLEGQIILVCDERWGLTPIGVSLPDYEKTVKKWNITPGDGAACRNGCLQLGGRWIMIEQIETPCASPAPVSLRRWQEGLEALRGVRTGLAPLALRLMGEAPEQENPWCALAAPRLEALCRAIPAGAAAAVETAAAGLLGLGPGLTPSADDVLCGMLYGLLRGGAAETRGVRALAEAVRLGSDRTHPVSTAYLRAIAAGAPFGRMEEAWLALTDRGPACFDRLLEVGSSSGADMLLGLLLAGKLLLRMEEWIDGGTDRTCAVG